MSREMMNDKSKGKETCLRFLDLGAGADPGLWAGALVPAAHKTQNTGREGEGRGLFFFSKTRTEQALPSLPNPSSLKSTGELRVRIMGEE